MIQRRVFVTGRVQGVSYRATTHSEALRHPSVRGFVRNLPDGRVEAVFAGDDHEVDKMVRWCAHGPGMARVDHLEVLEEAVDPSFTDFRVLK